MSRWRRSVPAVVAATGIVALLLLASSAMAAPLGSRNFAPPFHTATFAQGGHVLGGILSVQHSINLSGNYSLRQNASAVGNSSADWFTYGTYRSSTFALGSNITHLHANTSGIGTGSGVVDVRCFGSTSSGSAFGRFAYSIEYGVWDRTTSSWVGHHTKLVHAANVTLSCPHRGAVFAFRNLTLGWSLGINPSPAGVGPTDRLQIITIFIVHTKVSTVSAGSAAADVSVAATLLRMQVAFS